MRSTRLWAILDARAAPDKVVAVGPDTKQMAKDDSERRYWNDRLEPRDYLFGTEPADFLLQIGGLLPQSGKAIDLAGGEGRNAVYLARLGLDVEIWDLSSSGLAKASELARETGVTLRTVECDLESVELPPQCADVIVCFYYTQRSLFAAVEKALRPGGVLVFENVTTDQPLAERPTRDPKFRLAPNELLHAFPSLRVLFYREGVVERGVPKGKHVASLVARKEQS
ncbi:MAG: class I SAM-dependent methyltransferase [Candidatus Wallbacteria bacterium]|nr:class I SAM-dependent methyltransferase [Candidatus Wallbacteria bacterium]